MASFGINWRAVDETVDAMRTARDAGFQWVEFDYWDREYLPRLRGEELRGHCEKLLGLGGWLHRFAREALDLHIGFAVRPLTKYVLEEAMGMAGMIRVPLDSTEETGYWVRLSQSRSRPLVLYETTAAWPSPTVGRVPVFVAPGWPSSEKHYEPFFKSLSPEHRLGIAFHAKHEELFQAAVLARAPVIVQPVMPDTFPEAPDKAVSARVSTVAEWLVELAEDDVVAEEP